MKIKQISNIEKEIFEAIRNPEYDNFILLKVGISKNTPLGVFNYESSCICTITMDKDETLIQPLALLLNDELIEVLNLVCPDGNKPTK